MTKFFAVFCRSRIDFSADTWRKEYKSRTLKPGHYFPALPRDVSARPTRKSREQKKFSNTRYNVCRRMCLIALFENIFPHQTRYLTVQYKYEQVQNINVQNLTAVLRTHKQSLKLYRCAQRQAALPIAVWPSRGVRANGGSQLSVSDRTA